MTIEQILFALIKDFSFFGRAAGWIGVLLMLYLGRKMLKVLERIPSEQWFAEVGKMLKVLASHRQTVESHTGKIALLEADTAKALLSLAAHEQSLLTQASAIDELEAEVDDHEKRLSHLQGQHELLHGNALARSEAKGC